MRVKIKFSTTKEVLPIHNQHIVNSYVHNMLGRNNKYHDSHNSYCVSQLCGVKRNPDKETLTMVNPYLIISSDDSEFMERIYKGVFEVEFGYGLKFLDIINIEERFVNGWNDFNTLTPVLLKESVDRKTTFFTIDDADYVSKLKNNLVKKINALMPDKKDYTLDIKIHDNKYKKKRTLFIKNVKNVASSFNFSINSSKDIIECLYCVGLGHSTGSGFGTFYKSKNYHEYKF